jgi:hypothetical protein
MRGTEMPYEWSEVTMTRNSKTLASKPLAMTWVLNNNFQVFIHLPRMALWKGKTEPCARWLGRCSTSIELREGSGLRQSILRAMCPKGSTSASTGRKPAMNWCTVAHPRWVTSMSLVVNASFLRNGRSWTSSRIGLSMAFSLLTHLILEHFVCSILKLTKSWRLAR